LPLRLAYRSEADIPEADNVSTLPVIARLPKPIENPDAMKYYARWNGGFVEVSLQLAIMLSLKTGSECHKLPSEKHC
jgi:hypothetical protein